MEWAMRPSPMNPAAGRGATAGSHVRNGPAFVVVRTAAKLQGGGTAPGVGIQPWAEGELIDPVASATSDMGPRGPVKVEVAPRTRPPGTTLRRGGAHNPEPGAAPPRGRL